MNLHGMSDKECRRMIKDNGINGLEICDGAVHRLMTIGDTDQFPDAR